MKELVAVALTVALAVPAPVLAGVDCSRAKSNAEKLLKAYEERISDLDSR